MAWFNIRRPVSNLDACNRQGITPCLGAYDGSAVHSGLEANAQWRRRPLVARWRPDAAERQARRAASSNPCTNGQRPTNVPSMIARANVGYRFASLPGLAASAHLSHEGARSVLPDGSITLPAWTRIDAGLSYGHKLGGTQATWSLGIDNLFNRQFFKESPYQFGHVYLFPQQERTVRIGLKRQSLKFGHFQAII